MLLMAKASKLSRKPSSSGTSTKFSAIFVVRPGAVKLRKQCKCIVLFRQLPYILVMGVVPSLMGNVCVYVCM